MAKRKSTGKRRRFEIFKRDGFRCIYCGATPTQKTLRVDHVVPVADGGPDTPDNLVTACFDCNAGKAAEPLDRSKYERPMASEAMREHADQIREYLAIQQEIEAAKKEATDVIAAQWEAVVGPMTQAMYDRLPQLMATRTHEVILEAIRITAAKLGTPGAEFNVRDAVSQSKYFHGILRRRLEQGLR